MRRHISTSKAQLLLLASSLPPTTQQRRTAAAAAAALMMNISNRIDSSSAFIIGGGVASSSLSSTSSALAAQRRFFGASRSPILLNSATTTNNNNSNNKRKKKKNSLPESVLRSTIKIYANTSLPNFLIPWQKKQQQSQAGSGFVVDTRRKLLLTNTHVVAHAPFVEVRKHGDSEKYIGIILYMSAECDLALVHVPDEKFWFEEVEVESTTTTTANENDDGSSSSVTTRTEIVAVPLEELAFDTSRFVPSSNFSKQQMQHNLRNGGSSNNNNDSSSSSSSSSSPSAVTGLERLTSIGPFDGIPELQQDVKVIGYPMGGDQISITSGVVSRIDTTNYGGKDELLAIQLDAAINRGNSGGPALCVVEGGSNKKEGGGATDKNTDGNGYNDDNDNNDDEDVRHAVIGIAFQTLRNADNIGYIVPIPVAAHFFRCFLSSDVCRYLEAGEVVDRFNNGLRCRDYHSGFCTIGFIYNEMQNETLRKHFGLQTPAQIAAANNNNNASSSSSSSSVSSIQPTTGILITAVLPQSAGKGILKEHDVILAVNGHKIANDGTIEFRLRERLTFSHLVKSTPADTPVSLTILRKGEVKEVSVVPIVDQPLVAHHTFNEMYQEKPKYYIFGGLVFTPLSLGLLNEWGPEWYSLAPRPLTQAHLDEFPTDDRQQLVVVAQVLAHGINRGYEHCYARRVTHVGDQPIKSFAHFVEMMEKVVEKETAKKQQKGEGKGEEASDNNNNNSDNETITFGIQTLTSGVGGNVVALPVAGALKANEEIMNAYHIRQPMQL